MMNGGVFVTAAGRSRTLRWHAGNWDTQRKVREGVASSGHNLPLEPSSGYPAVAKK